VTSLYTVAAIGTMVVVWLVPMCPRDKGRTSSYTASALITFDEVTTACIGSLSGDGTASHGNVGGLDLQPRRFVVLFCRIIIRPLDQRPKSRMVGQLSLASLRGRLIEYQLRLG